MTIPWVDEDIDTAPGLLQREVEIGEHDSVGSRFDGLYPVGVQMLTEAAALVSAGNVLERVA